MALKDLSTLVQNKSVILTAPDGYKLKGVFKQYIPSAMRYEFEIFVGGSDSGTTVLFHKDTFNRYTITSDPEQ